MANPVVRSAQVFYRNKKVAEMYSGSYDQTAGRQMLFGAEGYLTHSKGAAHSRVSFDYVVPQAGVSFAVIADLLAQSDVDIAITVDGKVHRQTMAIVSNSMKWSTETGRFDGTITLEGGPMKVTG